MKKRLIGFLLAMSMLFALAACGETPAPTTEATLPPATTQAPTEAPLEPAAAYRDAVAALEEKAAYLLQVQRTKTVDVAGETFTTQWEQNISRSGDICKTANTLQFGNHLDEIWAEGIAYLNLNSTRFQEEMDLETFLARSAPLGLFTAENYGSITEEAGVISFEEATAAESWLAPEAATLVSSSGSAKLSPEGTLLESTYDLTYAYGGVTITEAWVVTYSEPKAAPKAPDAPESYLVVESIDGPLMAEQTTGFLMEAQQLHSNVYHNILSQAAGLYVTWGYQIDATEDMYRVQNRISQMTAAGTETYETDELYRDGTYTSTVDGGDPQTIAGVEYADMAAFGQETYTAALCDISFITESTVTDLGGLVIAEFQGNADWGDAARADTCYTIFQDETLLDGLASSHSDDTKEFYVALDKYTGLPTACGYSYSGSFSI